jgi:hypothetical protein
MVVDPFTQERPTTYEQAAQFPIALANGTTEEIFIDLLSVPNSAIASASLFYWGSTSGSLPSGSIALTAAGGTIFSYIFTGVEPLVANSGFYYLQVQTNPSAVTQPVTVWRSAVAPCQVTGVTPAPAVTGVSPGSGSHLGGTAVTITGTGFTGATAVDFGVTAATSVVVVSPEEITCVSPAHAAATVDVTVTTPAGTSPLGTPDEYIFT